MAEGLRYQFREDTRRGTPLEVTAPKSLVDYVSSGRGPLHANTVGRPDRRVFGRRFDGQGNITLDFDLGTNGVSYFHGPANIRSGITLEIIAQLDMAAKREGLSDPRVDIALLPLDRYSGGWDHSTPVEDEFFRVSFEQPNVDDDTMAKKIRQGMIRAADLGHMYNSHDHSVGFAVELSDKGGLDLRMGPFRADRHIMTTDPMARIHQGRIALYDPFRGAAEERLATLVGIISALDTIEV